GTTIGGSCTKPGTGSIGSACSVQNSQCTGSSGEGLGKCSCSDQNYQSATNMCSPIGTTIGGSCTKPGTGSIGSACSVQNSQCTGSSGKGLGKCSCSDQNYQSATNMCIGTTIGGSCTKPGTGSIGSACSVQNSQCTGASAEGLGTCSCSDQNYQSATNMCSLIGTTIGGSCTKPGTGSIGSACSVQNSQCTGSSGEGLGTCSCSDQNYQSATNMCSLIGTTIGGSCTKPGTGSIGSACSVQNSQCTGSSGEGLGKCSCSDQNYQSATNMCSPIGTTIGGSCTVPGTGSSGSPCNAPNSQCTGASAGGLGTCSCFSGYYQSATIMCSKIGTSIGVSCTKPSSGSVGSPCSAPASQCTGTSGEGAGTCSCLSGYYPSATNVCSTIGTSIGASCTKPSSGSSGNPCSATNSQCTGSSGEEITLDSRCDTSHSNLDQCAADNAICDSRYSYACKCRYGYYVDPSNPAICQAIAELRVTNINFQGISTSQFSVSWDIPDGKAQYIQTFVVEWMPKDNTIGGGTKTLSGSFTTALLDSGISAGKSYTVKITSINSQLGVNRSVFSSTDQDAKPNPPTWDAATDINPDIDNTITVLWNAPSGSVYGYQVSLIDGSTTVVTTGVLQSHFTRLTSPNIKNGYNYTVQIISKSESNTVESDPLTYVIKTEVIAPGAPTGANCKEVADEFITVDWNAPAVSNGDLRQYFVHGHTTTSECTQKMRNTTLLYMEKHPPVKQSQKSAPTSSRVCNGGDRNDESKSKEELQNSTLTFSNNTFKPDTDYTVLVAAVNGIGWGYQAEQSVRSKEEEPQEPPKVVNVSDIGKTSFNVSWSLIGPRPGQVTYTVILTADTGAESKTYTVKGKGFT
ncbi:hypothetical protein MAR_018094, partial [Mya arenaria]